MRAASRPCCSTRDEREANCRCSSTTSETSGEPRGNGSEPPQLPPACVPAPTTGAATPTGTPPAGCIRSPSTAGRGQCVAAVTTSSVAAGGGRGGSEGGSERCAPCADGWKGVDSWCGTGLLYMEAAAETGGEGLVADRGEA